MSEKSQIDKVKVLEPCHESWDEMLGNERVKLCSHCTKHVTNISTLTRKEAMRLVNSSDGSICIRYTQNPFTNKPLFADQLVQIARRAPRVAAGIFSATLSLATISYAQATDEDATQQTQTVFRHPTLDTDSIATDTETNEEKDAKGIISGKLRDLDGSPVSGVDVVLVGTKEWDREYSTTNDLGEYTFNDLEPGRYTIRIQIDNGDARKAAPAIVISKDETLTVDLNVRVIRNYVMNSSDDGSEIGVGEGVSSSTGVGFGGMIAVARYATPLMEAVNKNELETVKQLLQKGAKVNERDPGYDGITPIYIAVENGNVEMVRLLLYYGAKVNIKSEDGRTPLMFIDGDASPELIHLLIDRGADINAVSGSGLTPLIAAVENSSIEAAKIFLNLGCDPDSFTDENSRTTLLMSAVESGNEEMAALLIKAGADVNAKDASDETAWDLTSDQDLEKMLVEAGARVNFDIELHRDVVIENTDKVKETLKH